LMMFRSSSNFSSLVMAAYRVAAADRMASLYDVSAPGRLRMNKSNAATASSSNFNARAPSASV
jgi:hypothetical protein